MNVQTYDPYTYNPMLQAFFVTGNFGKAPLPDTAKATIAQNPELAPHINSVWNFLSWMKDSTPELYNLISNQQPALVDPAAVVLSGALGLKNVPRQVLKTRTLRGLGDATDYTAIDNYPTASDVAVYTADATVPAPSTAWGEQIMSLLKDNVPAILQLKSQNDLMKINIARAEKGLDPVDSAALAPQVNVGASKSVTTLGYVAIGALMLVGIMAAMKKK